MFNFSRWPVLGNLIFGLRAIRHELRVNPTFEALSSPDIHLYTIEYAERTGVVRLELAALNPEQTLDCFLDINPRLRVMAMDYIARDRYWVLVIENLPVYTPFPLGKIFLNRDLHEGYHAVKLKALRDIYGFVGEAPKTQKAI